MYVCLRGLVGRQFAAAVVAVTEGSTKPKAASPEAQYSALHTLQHVSNLLNASL